MNRLNGYLDSYVAQAGFRQHGGIYSGIALGDIVLQSSGQVHVSGTNISLVVDGRQKLTHIHESGIGWAATTPFLTTGGPGNSGLFPIALSGLYSLDMAYHAGREVYLRQPYGNLFIYAVALRPIFVGTGRASLNISGVLGIPVASANNANFEGDVAMCHHSTMSRPPAFAGSPLNGFTPPASEEEANARALGIGTLFLNTGSGITNVSVGSGILYATTVGTTTIDIIPSRFSRIRLSDMYSDRNYAYDTAASGFRFMSPGFYRGRYNVSLEKSQNTTLQAVVVRAVRYQASQDATLQNDSATIEGSIAYGSVQNLTTYKFGSISNEFYFNADPNDLFGLEVAYSNLAGGAQIIVVNTSGTNVCLEKIGPKRSSFS